MSHGKKKELSEEEAFEIALEDHPEYRRAFLKDKLPEEVVDEEGNAMNPRAHLEMHAVVERQLASDNPPGVAAIAQELRDLRVSRHNIRHAIAGILSEEMWHMMKENRVFDEKRYLDRLRAFVKSQRGH